MTPIPPWDFSQLSWRLRLNPVNYKQWNKNVITSKLFLMQLEVAYLSIVWKITAEIVFLCFISLEDQSILFLSQWYDLQKYHTKNSCFWKFVYIFFDRLSSITMTAVAAIVSIKKTDNSSEYVEYQLCYRRSLLDVLPSAFCYAPIQLTQISTKWSVIYLSQIFFTRSFLLKISDVASFRWANLYITATSRRIQEKRILKILNSC